MTYLSTLRSAACLAALASGNAAFAQVTAQQVWDDWKTDMTLFGGDIATTAEDMSGNALIVRGLTLTTTDEDITSVLSMDMLTFTEQGDGSVTVTSSDSYPMVFTGEDDTVITVQISHPGLALNVSGTPEALDYTLAGDRLTIALQDVVTDGVTFTGDMQLVVNALSGTYATRTGEMRNTTYDIAATSMDVLVDITPPDAPGDNVTIGGRVNGVTVQADITSPRDPAAIDPEQMLMAGMALAGG